MDGWMDGWMDGRTDGRMDRQTDRQTDKYGLRQKESRPRCSGYTLIQRVSFGSNDRSGDISNGSLPAFYSLPAAVMPASHAKHPQRPAGPPRLPESTVQFSTWSQVRAAFC